MIKNVRMNWEMEHHTFTFDTNGCKMEALDFLGDFMLSLKNLQSKIAEEYNYEDDLPARFKVHGGCCNTNIQVVELS